jgi:hypothetical protein
MKARASCPFTSRSGPIPDHSDCGRTWRLSPNWTAFGMERGGICHPFHARPAPPTPRHRGVRDQRGMEATSGAV